MALKRDSIMIAVVERMKSIRSSNGYHSELGLNVFEWRPKIADTAGGYIPTEQDELPAIHVSDPAVNVSQENVRGSEAHRLTIEVEVAHEGGATGKTMREQITDVRKALGVDRTWGGIARRTFQDMSTETIRIQADRSFFRTLIRASIEYTTAAFAEE